MSLFDFLTNISDSWNFSFANFLRDFSKAADWLFSVLPLIEQIDAVIIRFILKYKYFRILLLQKSTIECAFDKIKYELFDTFCPRLFSLFLLSSQISPLILCESDFCRKVRGLKNFRKEVAFFFDQIFPNPIKYDQEENRDQKRYG